MNERSIFLAALDISDPDERKAFVAKECAGDDHLLRQVEALLAANASALGFLDEPALLQMADAEFGDATLASTSPITPMRKSDETQAEPAGTDDHDYLAFLSPSSKPGSLGRVDHYEVLQVVGRGGMGLVLKVFDEKLHRVVAIKILAPQLATSGTARKRFVREARAAAAIAHEHVVDIHAVGDEGPVPYLVMQFLDAVSLEEYIKKTGMLELKETLRIGLQAAEGLAAAHKQGLVHRDIKPGNILLENGVHRVKITDFGLARTVDDASLTQSGVVAGTPSYMSPEQAAGEPVDHRSDLFSLGSVLYTMCTGRPPFRASGTLAVLKRVCEDTPRPIREVNPDIPDWMEVIVARLMEKEPAKRFQSAREVADLLGQHLAYLQQPSLGTVAMPKPPVPSRERTPKKAKHGFRAAAVLLGVLLVIGGTTGYWIWKNKKEDEGGPPIVPGKSDPKVVSLNFDREQILPALLVRAGNGNPDAVPPEIVALFGDGAFVLPHPGRMSWMTQSADGEMLAVPCGDVVVLFAAKDGSLLQTLRGHNGNIYTLAFSPDGKYLAGGNWDGDNTIRLWDVQTGKTVRVFQGHGNFICGLAFNKDGSHLVSTSGDSTAKVWNRETGKEEFVLRGHTDWVRAVCYSHDGKTIFTASRDNTIKAWNAKDGKEEETLRGHTHSLLALALSPDGRWLVSGNDEELVIWDAEKRQVVKKCSSPAGWLAFSPDSKSLWTATHGLNNRSCRVTRWDPKADEPLAVLSLPLTGAWAHYQFDHQQGVLFAMCGEQADQRISAFDAKTGKELFPRRGHLGGVGGVAFDKSGAIFASGGQDRTAKIWDPLTGAVKHNCTGHRDFVIHVAVSPDGRTLATAGRDGDIKLWDTHTGKEKQTLRGHKGFVFHVAFSPDGKLLASASADKTAKLWYLDTDRAERTFAGFANEVTAIAFSPDGAVLAAAARDATIRRWNVADGVELAVLRGGHGGAIRSLAFHPDGKTLTSGGEDWLICEWDLSERKLKQTIRGHGADAPGTGVISLAWDSKGRLLASCGSADGTIRFWDNRTSPPLCRTVLFPAGFSLPNHVAFTPDDRFLAVATESGLIAMIAVPQLSEPYNPGPARKVPDPASLAKLPSPADALDAKNIPPLLLQNAVEKAGKTPDGLVAILSDARFVFPEAGLASYFEQSPDGKLLAVPKGNNIVVFETPSGKLLRALEGPGGRVRNVAFSPDTQLLAASAWDDDAKNSKVRVWDVTAGWKVLERKPPPTHGVYYLTFTHDSKQLICAGVGEQAICVADARSGENNKVLPLDAGFHPILSTSGKRMAAADWNSKKVVIWDADSWKEIKTVDRNFVYAGDVRFSRDGKILTVGSDSEVKLWNTDTWKEIRAIATSAQRLELTPDGETLLTWRMINSPLVQDHVIARWNVKTGEKLGEILVKGEQPDTIFANLSRDGKELFVVHGAAPVPYVRIFDVQTGQEKSRQGHNKQVYGVAFSPDGKTLASGSMDGTARLWDLESGQQRHILTDHRAAVRYPTFSPDSKLLATPGEDDTIKLWDVTSGKCLRTLAGHDGIVERVVFTPDSKNLISISRDRVIKLWDVATGKQLRSFGGTVPGDFAGYWALAVSPDGKIVATGERDKAIRLWDIATGWELAVFTGHQDWVRGLAFHASGQKLASCSYDNTCRIWDLTGMELKTFKGHTDWLLDLAWSPDGRTLISAGSNEGTVRLWDTEAQSFRSKEIRLFPPRTLWIHGLAISPEGRYLATANPDGTIYILRLAERGTVLKMSNDK